MATFDSDTSALPGTGPGAREPALARAGAPAPGGARDTSVAATSKNHRGRANGPSQRIPAINLILADPARVRVTRKTQGAALPGGVGDPPAPQRPDPLQTRLERPPGAAPVPGEGSGEAREPQADQSALAAISVPTARLHSSRLRSRTPYDETAIRALAASIRTKGWQQPILVRPHPLIARDYEIVVGELPFQAARFAGLESLPVAVCGLSDYRALECVLLEDVQRSDLAPLDVAVGYGQLIRTFHYSLADLAKLAGRSERQVARLLLLLDPPEAPRRAPDADEVNPEDRRPAGPACDAAGLPATGGAADAASPMTAEISRLARTQNGARHSLNAELAALERHLSGVLGLKVEMTARGRQGAVRISFADLGQLESIARHLSSFGVRSGVAPKYPGLAA